MTSEALKIAYASASQTPIMTVEFYHSSIGYLRLAKANSDLIAVIEGSTTVTFSRAAIDLSLPSKTTTGKQDLDIQISNASIAVYAYINTIKKSNRTSQEKVTCKFRQYLLDDLTGPSGPVYDLVVMSTSINDRSAGIRASYSAIVDTVFPRGRYFTNLFPGLKYV